MRVQLDLEALERLIVRNCQTALAEFGFELEENAPSLLFSFAYQENDCVGLEISQTFPENPPPST